MPESRGLLPGWLPAAAASTAAARSRPGGGAYDGASHLYAFDLDGIDTTFAASGRWTA